MFYQLYTPATMLYKFIQKALLLQRRGWGKCPGQYFVELLFCTARHISQSKAFLVNKNMDVQIHQMGHLYNCIANKVSMLSTNLQFALFYTFYGV